MSELRLPEGWLTTSIDQISVKGEQRKPELTEEFVYVDIGSIDRLKKSISEPQRLLGKDAPSRARKEIETGDVLVSLTRPNLNAVALVTEKYNKQIASTGFEVIRPLQVDPRYVFSLTRSKHFVNSISGKVQGALYPAAKSSDVKGYEFPLPPLNEQTRIANKLDELLAQVDTIKARVDAIPAILKRFRQSVLAAAVSGKLTAATSGCDLTALDLKGEWITHQEESFKQAGKRPKSNGWMKKAPSPVHLPKFVDLLPKGKGWGAYFLSDIILSKNQGVNTTTEKVTYSECGVPVIQAGNVENGRIVFKTNKYIDDEKFKSLSHSVKPKNGDVLYTNIGANFGNSSAIESVGFDFLITWNVLKITPSSFLNPKYLACVLNSHRIRAEAIREVSTSTVPFVNGKTIGNFVIPLPSIEEQKKIVKKVEQLFAFADQVEQRVTDAQSRIDSLTQSILAKAFRGELVPQDPNDEPASELLARIQKERIEAAALLKKTKQAAKKAAKKPAPKTKA